MSWLDALFLKYRTIRANSVDVPQRAAINFLGGTVTDDPDNDETNVTISGGGGSGGGVVTAVSTSALTALSIVDLDAGTLAYVETLKSYFVLDPASSLALQSMVILATASTGRWIRTPYAHPFWGAQTTWNIDPVSGNDEGGGISPGLKTLGELTRRWGQWSKITASSTVTILSSVPESDPLNLYAQLGAGVTLLFNGTAIAGPTGTFTAVTAKNRSTNQTWNVTDSGLSGTWTSHLAQRLRITSGARVGGQAWVVADNGSKTAVTSEWAIPDSENFIITTVAPQSGDPYIIETFPTMYIGALPLFGDQSSDSGFTFVRIDNVNIPNTPLEPQTGAFSTGIDIGFAGCKIDLTYLSNATVTFQGGCYLSRGVACQGGDYNGLACYYGGLFSVSALQGDVSLDGDCFVTGDGIQIQPGCGMQIGTTSCFASSGNGISIAAGATLLCVDTSLNSSFLWGSGSSAFGLSVAANGTFTFQSNTPTLTGLSGDFKLGSATSARAFDETTGAATTSRTCTWAHVAASIGSGGFGGSAHNFVQNAHVVTL